MARATGQAAGVISKGANIPGRRVLGRGLSALIGPVAVSFDRPEGEIIAREQHRDFITPGGTEQSHEQSGESILPEGGLLFLPIDRVRPNINQPRKHFDSAEIEALSKSIRDTGVLQPIIVRRISSGSVGVHPGLGQGTLYEIVAGERRYRAAKLAGLLQIPAILKQLDDKDALQLGLIENVQRSDLNPIEEAEAYQRLAEEYQLSQGEIAELVGKDRPSIANAIRLLKLSPAVKELLVDKKLSAGHGRALLKIENPEQQIALAQLILRQDLSVRKAEELSANPEGITVTERPHQHGSKLTQKSPTVLELEERIRKALGTKVSLSLHSAGKGELRISFFSEQELERLLERLSI